MPAGGATITATVTYAPATELGSVSIFDYWSPATAVQRVLFGAGGDQMEILVNGDYHEFHFSGIAKDLMDSASFEAGAAQLQSFPAEPTVGAFDYSIVPGNMGQAWLGTGPSQFCTITAATLTVKNALDPREREFGAGGTCSGAREISPGERTVTAAFELFSKDDDATKELYQASRFSLFSVSRLRTTKNTQVANISARNHTNQMPMPDCAKACTELTTPLRVRNVPKMASRNVVKMSHMFHIFIMPRFSCIMTECRKAVMVRNGRIDAFSTGSHPQ